MPVRHDSMGDTALLLAQHEKHADIVELLKPPDVKQTQPSDEAGHSPGIHGARDDASDFAR